MREQQIKSRVDSLVRRCGTTDPFEIADQIGILYQFGESKYEGCYMFLKNHRYIFLSNRLTDEEKRLVMAHELGHAVLHRKENCYFIRNKTLFLESKIEKEANIFAADLLISDEILFEAISREYTVQQLARLSGCCEEIARISLEQLKDTQIAEGTIKWKH